MRQPELLPYCPKKGISRLKALDVNELTRFRDVCAHRFPLERSKSAWPRSSTSVESENGSWKTPVLSIKLPEVTPAPTLPFEPDQFARILAACDEYPIKGIYREGNRTRLRAMVLLLRYTGLRIRDGVTIKRDRIVAADSTSEFPRVFLYTQKTGTPVFVPVPQEVVDALDAVPIVHPQHIFWSGGGDPKSAVADWQRSFRRLITSAVATQRSGTSAPRSSNGAQPTQPS